MWDSYHDSLRWYCMCSSSFLCLNNMCQNVLWNFSWADVTLTNTCSAWWSLTKRWWVVESWKHCSSWWYLFLVLQRTLGSLLSVSEEPCLRARRKRRDYSCSNVRLLPMRIFFFFTRNKVRRTDDWKYGYNSNAGTSITTSRNTSRSITFLRELWEVQE